MVRRRHPGETRIFFAAKPPGPLAAVPSMMLMMLVHEGNHHAVGP